MISKKQQVYFRRLEKYLTNDYGNITRKTLNKYGQQGLEAVKAATPVATGKTRDSWSMSIKKVDDKYSLSWSNSNLTKDGEPVVVLLEYGHGKPGGGYVPGRKFVHESLDPVMEQIEDVIDKNLKRKSKEVIEDE